MWNALKAERNERRTKLFTGLRNVSSHDGLVVDWAGMTNVTVYVCVGPAKDKPSDGRQILEYKSPNRLCRLQGQKSLIFGEIFPVEKRLVNQLMTSLAMEIRVRMTIMRGSSKSLEYKFYLS